MNICFYTTEQPSAANRLNMNHLVQNRPDHNYSFLIIKSKSKQRIPLKEKIRSLYGEMRFNDGRFEFQRDSLKIEKKLNGFVVPIDFKNFIKGYADQVNDEKSVQFLNKIQPDLIIQAGAGIMKPNTFSIASKASINVHHGIAPDIRGIDSTFWCMFYGIKDKIGVSCHFIEETLDTGAIITQRFLNSKSNSFADIQLENYLLGKEVLLQSVDKIAMGGYKIVGHGDTKSYYFGIVNPFFYYALKKRNFWPLMNINSKTFKIKEKKYLEY